MKPSRKDRDVVPKARDFSLEGEGFLDGMGQDHRRPQGGGGGRGVGSLNYSDREEARRKRRTERFGERRKAGLSSTNVRGE